MAGPNTWPEGHCAVRRFSTEERLHQSEKFLARLFPVLRSTASLHHGIYEFRRGNLVRAYRQLRQSLHAARRHQLPIDERWANYWLGRLAQTATGRWLLCEGAAPYYAAALEVFARLEAAWELTQVRAALAAYVQPAASSG